MKTLKIEAAIDTPEIILDPDSKIFSISGISHPENAKEFYKVILDWLDDFYDNVQDKQNTKITINFNFKYINSSSYKYLRDVLKKISHFHQNGMEIEIIWNYHEDDEDLLNEGMVLFELPDVSLEYQCVPYS